MSLSTTMTIPLDFELKNRLDKISEVTQRSKSFLATEAVREFIEINEWQIDEIQKALKEVDAEDFSSNLEVVAFFNKWGLNGE